MSIYPVYHPLQNSSFLYVGVLDNTDHESEIGFNLSYNFPFEFFKLKTNDPSLYLLPWFL